MTRDRPGIEPCNDLPAVRQLLMACDLPTADLSASTPVRFLAMRDDTGVRGIIGLETHGTVGLLRSLAVTPRARGSGCGGRLVSALEHRARGDGLAALYLLTNTAVEFFAARGYDTVARADVPAAIRATAEFAQLCPADATVMLKQLAPA